jgi:cytochrome P450
VTERILSLTGLGEWLPTEQNRAFERSRRALDRLVLDLVAERRRTGVRGEDLLSMLLEAEAEGGAGRMSDRQVRDEVMSIFLAGHETTANALAWTFYLLAQHPGVRARLDAELDAVLGDRAPQADDAPRLQYTLMVIEEAMRLYPPGWVLVRVAVEDDEIDGYAIPRGSIVALSPWVTHRDPRHWPDPERFDPERFDPARKVARPRYAYFPFSGGPRQCIGKHFALLEMQLVVAAVAQRYRLELPPGREVTPEAQLTLRPRHGLPMRLVPTRS